MVWDIWILGSEFVSDFEFEISDFAAGGRTNVADGQRRGGGTRSASRSRRVIRTLASTENPLFSQASMSAAPLGRFR
jgi:hypothetical protein